MTITDYISFNAEKYANDEAIIFVKRKNNIENRLSLSWSEFNNLASQVANYLISEGVCKDDKIAILLPNTIEWLPIYFGILMCGAVVVSLNYLNNEEEIYYCIEVSECKHIFVSQELPQNIINHIQEEYFRKIKCCLIKTDFKENIEKFSRYDPLKPSVKIKGNDNAAIYFSSGTTGNPKAVLISHSSLKVAAEREWVHHRQIQKDKFLCVSPLFHTGAIVHWFGSLLVGGAIVILKNIDPANIIKTIESETVTITWLPVPQIQDILDMLDFSLDKIDVSKLRCLRLMHSGAQHVPATLIKRWIEHFPDVLYDTSYGLTETTGPGCINLGTANIHKMGAIGKSDELWCVKIVDENGVEVSQGEIGEIVLKGPSVMKEYYKDQCSTLQVKKGDWLYTGDVAYKDVDGFIYIVDRKKDVIITGGENIYPVQIENFLRRHKAIKDVAVIGAPNMRLGEIVVAAVELLKDDSCTKAELHRFCEDLPIYKRPVRFYFTQIPRNATGKIDKIKLRGQIFTNGL